MKIHKVGGIQVLPDRAQCPALQREVMDETKKC